MMRQLYSIFFMLMLSLGAVAQHGTPVPIANVQFVAAPDLLAGDDEPTLYEMGDTVTVDGVVTFHGGWYGLASGPSRRGSWIQAEDRAPWSGIHLLAETGSFPSGSPYTDLTTLLDAIKFYENMVRGLKVRVTGVVTTFSNYTQLELLPIEAEILSLTPVDIQPLELEIDTFMQNDGAGNQVPQLTTGEKYESMLVRFEDVTVVDVQNSGNGRYYWSVQDAEGNRMQIRDMSGWLRNDDRQDSMLPANYQFSPPAEGSRLQWIQGIVFHNGGSGYMLAPRDTNDIGPIAVAPPKVEAVTRDILVPTSQQPVEVRAKITDDQGQVASATLYYNGASGLQQVPMTEVVTDTFAATIPAQPDEELVQYWIRAEDANGNALYFPDSLMTGLVYMVLDDGIDEIADLQAHLAGSSIWDMERIEGMTVTGVVTSTLSDLGLTTIQDGTDPYSGIYLQASLGDSIEFLHRGDQIRITAADVTEVFGVTHLENVEWELVQHAAPVPQALQVPIDSITGSAAYAEQYEAMLLEFNDVYIVDDSADAPSHFGEFFVNHDLADASGLRVDDYSTRIPYEFTTDSIAEDDFFDYVRGVLFYSFSNWKLLPRDFNDLAGYELATEIGLEETAMTVSEAAGAIEVAVVLENESNTATSVDIAVASGSEATAGNDFTLSATDVTFPANSFAYTTFTVSIVDDSENEDDEELVLVLTNPQGAELAQDTLRITITDNEGVSIGNQAELQGVSIYPNPANSQVWVALEASEGTTTIRLTDLTGREVLRKEMGQGQKRLLILTGQLQAGTYLMHVSQPNGQTVQKVLIQR